MLVFPLENVRNHSGAGLLAGLVQVGVDVGGGGQIRVAQEVGHVDQRHILVDEQAGEGVTKLVEATNGHSLVEAENAICYDIVRDYGLRRSLFCERGISSHGTKKQKTSVHGNG